MFGSGVPVLAYSYPCLKELVIDGRNGLTFSNATELTEQLWSIFEGYPSGKGQQLIEYLRSHLVPRAKTESRKLGSGRGGESSSSLSSLKLKMKLEEGEGEDETKVGLESWEVMWEKVMRPVVKRMLDDYRRVKGRGYQFVLIALLLQLVFLFLTFVTVSTLMYFGVM